MLARARTVALVLAAIALTGGLSGCGLAVSHGSEPHSSAPAQANPGESEGTVASRQEAPARGVAPTPTQAIERFASLYINWNYRSLAGREDLLASMAIGAARQSELAAAQQARRDTAIAQGHIYNSGTVVAIAAVIGASADHYAVVTKEQTGGDQEYAGLAAAFHVTFTTVQAVAGGWAVSEWEPAT